jgi:GNAT superfamily N-acetyltransferase
VSGLDVLRWGPERLRWGPWRGDPSVAYLAPAPGSRPPTADAVRHAVDHVRSRGFARVVTSALSDAEQAGFLTCGFDVVERLHLLAHDLADVPPRPEIPTRRAHRRDRPQVLAVDAAAFDPFWILDENGLVEALTATPVTRFRIIVDDEIAAYAVSGRAESRGYLQRLADAPGVQGKGYGRALVADCLRWMRRRGVARVVVNTQERNQTALALYESMGFRRQPRGLAVLGRDLEPG